MLEDIVRATCNGCGHDVEFLQRPRSKKRKPEPMLKQERCRDCKGSMFLKATKKHKPGAAYHFSHYWYCISCHKMFHDERFKIYNV